MNNISIAKHVPEGFTDVIRGGVYRKRWANVEGEEEYLAFIVAREEKTGKWNLLILHQSAEEGTSKDIQETAFGPFESKEEACLELRKCDSSEFFKAANNLDKPGDIYPEDGPVISRVEIPATAMPDSYIQELS